LQPYTLRGILQSAPGGSPEIVAICGLRPNIEPSTCVTDAMGLLVTMLPLYLLGNLHCIGMCGPLVMFIGKHRYRNLYFLGRTASFSFAGLIAGAVGGALSALLERYHVAAITSFLFGSVIIAAGVCALLRMDYPGQRWLAHRLSGVSGKLSLLLMRDMPFATFLFGFGTVLLPCGQTLVVFSACALAADPTVGLINGCAFAILTSPSLWLAMRAHGLLNGAKKHYNLAMGVFAIAVGVLAIARGLADLQVIDHLVLNQSSSTCYHVVIY
jgi:sulfite exporter TauE/SafE